MREILFRGKRTDNGEWTYGYFVSQGKETYIFEQREVDKGIDLGGYLDCCQMREVAAPTVGQFTGLTDKNGKKIFEGDILDLRCWYVAYCGDLNEGFGMNAGWYHVRDNFESWGELECNRDHEILGNVHDNPELLKWK